MAENTTQLIQKILDGDDDAFSSLVKKYQKGIHALAWRKIGDYHIAQEITQDVFLQVYEKLSTLRNPEQFDGWIYVITNRRCINWLQRNKPKAQPLSETPEIEIEKAFYRHYETEHRQTESNMHYREVVQLLLEKLPESERTVITLYYIGEMTPTQISKFLGVSVNTIKSRLRRAQDRLQSEVKNIIDELFGDLRLSSDLTENIMRKIEEIKPEPVVAKPFLPWAAIGASFVLVLLLLGAMNQYITHFQQPYNFEALSEPTIEIVESLITVDVVTNTVERKRLVGNISSNNSNGTSSQISETVIDSNNQNNSLKFSNANWTYIRKPRGTTVFHIFATSEDDIYAIAGTGIYKLVKSTNTWSNVTADIPIRRHLSPVTHYKGVIYAINSSSIHFSTDKGKTWEVMCSIPQGFNIGLIVQNNTSVGDSEEGIVMYLALKEKGVFKSIDLGKQWTSMNKGLEDKKISVIDNIDNTLFIGTNQGLYRLNSGIWEKLPVDPNRKIESLAVYKHNLYIVTGPESQKVSKTNSQFLRSEARDDKSRRIFHSENLGNSWREITPKNNFLSIRLSSDKRTKISANGKSLYVYGSYRMHSMDQGKSWIALESGVPIHIPSHPSVFSLTKDTYYSINMSGLHRSTDNGTTWHPFMDGILGTRVIDMIAFNNRLYVNTGNIILVQIDDERGWESIPVQSWKSTGKAIPITYQYINHLTESKFAIVNNVLYGIIQQGSKLYIYKLSAYDTHFSMIKAIPFSEPTTNSDRHSSFGSFTVGDNILYIEFNRRLFKWKDGSSKIENTGVIDTTKYSNANFTGELKVAASSDTVYVGKRDGRLVRSDDQGNNWQDITSNLPYIVSNFKDITFVGNTVYVSTDKGVLASQNGDHWRRLTNTEGKHIIIDKFTTHKSNIYGASDIGAYYLDQQGNWEHIYPNIQDKVISLTCTNDKLYIATEQQGIRYASIK